MIVLKLVSKKGLKNTYEFDALGLSGEIIVNTETFDIQYQSATGHYENDEKAKGSILYKCLKVLKSENFPNECIYATH